jgi:hypothetical protein
MVLLGRDASVDSTSQVRSSAMLVLSTVGKVRFWGGLRWRQHQISSKYVRRLSSWITRTDRRTERQAHTKSSECLHYTHIVQVKHDSTIRSTGLLLGWTIYCCMGSVWSPVQRFPVQRWLVMLFAAVMFVQKDRQAGDLASLLSFNWK